MLNLLFSRLCLKELKTSLTTIREISSTSSLFIKTSPILLAEPLKKKKKIDPAVIRQREERKKKKLEKQIRRLEKNARQLKPIDELEVPMNLIDERQSRTRTINKITSEETNNREKLIREWSRYKLNERSADFQIIDRIQMAQEKALNELRKESEELYQEAIQLDLKLLPFIAKGPVTTPPIKGYDAPDGEYIDVSKKWEEDNKISKK